MAFAFQEINDLFNYLLTYLLSRLIKTTGAALIENNEASAKLTTANGGTFTWAQLDSAVANHVTARSIGDWRALTWLATATAELDVNVPPFAVVSLSVSTWFHTTWMGGTASRLYICVSLWSRLFCTSQWKANNKAEDHPSDGSTPSLTGLDWTLCRNKVVKGRKGTPFPISNLWLKMALRLRLLQCQSTDLACIIRHTQTVSKHTEDWFVQPTGYDLALSWLFTPFK